MSIEVITNNYFESPLDFGIDITDQSVHHVDNTVVEQNIIANPFYVGFDGGSLSKEERKVMYNYNNVIVLLNNNLSPEFIELFFKRTINTETLEQFPQNSVQYKRVSINILKNQQFYVKTNIVSDKHMSLLFAKDKFNPEELVFSMFELDISNAIEYLKMYTEETTITHIKLPLQLAKTYNKHNLEQVSKNISRMFFNLKDNDFWTKQNSCKLNITNMFTVRDFQSRTGNNNLVLLAQSPDREKQATVDGDSKSYSSTRNKFEQFCDISTILKDNKKSRTFYATIPDTQITNKDILDIIKSTNSEKSLYELTNNMLISKEYCHYIFSKDVLENINKLINKYPGIFKYTFGYAMLTLYLEECLFLTKSTKNSRFVFDINTANKLPTFPFLSHDLKLNPYVSVLIHNDNLDMKTNACGIKCIENYDGYGVCDLETFKKRMNIFISGDITKDVFANVNMKDYGVSGSIIAACLQKRNPLYDAYINEYKDENIAFKHFIDNYYGNSDIDIMCNTNSYTEYIMKSYELYKKLIENISPDAITSTLSKDKKYSYDTVRTVGITLSDEFFKETLEDFNIRYGTTWTLTEYMNSGKDMRVRMYLHSKYYNFKMMSNEQLYRSGRDTTNEFLNLFMQPLTIDQLTIYYTTDETYKFEIKKDTDFIFYINDFRKENNKVKENENKPIIKIGESIRFKMNFPTINKTFEVFKSTNNDFFSTVARFHLPCVRAYYTDNNVYILPSCVGAMMTNMNIDYKYFAGIRDPYQIVTKYMKRGFGVILNKDELKQLEEHVKKNNLSMEYIGPKEVYSNMFTQFENKKEYKYIETYDSIKKYYNQFNKTIDITQFNTISNNGNINMCIKSFIDFYYETSK
jgi:hypothetical protein